MKLLSTLLASIINLKTPSELVNFSSMLRHGLENPLRLQGRVAIIVSNDIDHVNWRMYVDLDKCTVSPWSLRHCCPVKIPTKSTA